MTSPLGQFAKDMAEHDCTYGDNCPIFGSNHGRCTGCQARTALEESKNEQPDYAADIQLSFIADWCEKLTGVNNNTVIGTNGWPSSISAVIALAVEKHIEKQRVEVATAVAASYSQNDKIVKLREEISAARDAFNNSKNGSKSDYDLSFGRLMKVINKFNDARSYKIKELGLDTF